MKNHRINAYLFLLATSAIWGFAGPVIKFTLAYFPPSVFLTYRFAVSTIVAVTTFLLFPKNFPKNTKDLPVILLYGFLVSTTALGLLFIGFEKTTALTGSLIGALSPIMITTAGVLFLREHVTGREKLGISIALGGTLITIFEPLLLGSTNGLPVSFEGNMYHVASLTITVATALLAKMILRTSIDPLTLTHISFTIGFATMLPITLSNHSVSEIMSYLQAAPLAGHLGVLFMSLLSGTLAYTFWHLGQKTIEIGETSLFSYFMPLFAAPLSVFWLHEKISIGFLLGAACITAGVVVAEYRKSIGLRVGRATQRRRKR